MKLYRYRVKQGKGALTRRRGGGYHKPTNPMIVLAEKRRKKDKRIERGLEKEKNNLF